MWEARLQALLGVLLKVNPEVMLKVTRVNIPLVCLISRFLYFLPLGFLSEPKHPFLAHANRWLCLLSGNLGYAIQKIVLVLVSALRVVELCRYSLCNATTMLAIEV